MPNPACVAFNKYEWIGKLMGACLRSEENLAITLSSFFWKLLAEHKVSWTDYMSVDETQVMTLNQIEKMDKDTYDDTYNTTFDSMRTWTVVLSDGTSVPLKPDGNQLSVSYEERLEYVQLVREARLNETKQQVDAIRKGLLQVIPKAVLRLLTSDELEIKICGCPEISFENLQKQVIFNDASTKDSEQVKHLWKVLENFTSNDRSQFLRFVTGRRRLPAAVYVELTSGRDVLPSASTCGHHFVLPSYTTAQKAEEMIRLAIYSSKFIDTDTAIVN
jgi:E3 ubiquitin-protein ligase HECTD3